jgi:uncharacterized membrane protein
MSSGILVTFSSVDIFGQDYPNASLGYLLLCILAVVALWLISANTVILGTIIRHHQLRNISNVMVANIAASNLGMGLIFVMSILRYSL